jgi:GNAT superfamily N-acetyltransferase
MSDEIAVANGSGPSANVDLTMVRGDLDGIPAFPLPDGYAIRPYAPGDERAWVDLQSAADAYNVITPALFRRAYGDDVEELGLRLFMLVGPTGAAVGTGTRLGTGPRFDDDVPVGTAAAWFGDRKGDPSWGRVHWVAIHPAHQGRGLAKPLLSRVCTVLRELGHTRAYLTTGSARVAAIALYLRFGFVPAVDGPDDEAAWAELLRAVPDLTTLERYAVSDIP